MSNCLPQFHRSLSLIPKASSSSSECNLWCKCSLLSLLSISCDASAAYSAVPLRGSKPLRSPLGSVNGSPATTPFDWACLHSVPRCTTVNHSVPQCTRVCHTHLLGQSSSSSSVSCYSTRITQTGAVSSRSTSPDGFLRIGAAYNFCTVVLWLLQKQWWTGSWLQRRRRGLVSPLVYTPFTQHLPPYQTSSITFFTFFLFWCLFLLDPETLNLVSGSQLIKTCFEPI